MRALLAVIAAFPLSGCFAGDAIYAPADARIAMPPGIYRSLRDREPGNGRVSILPNGMTRMRGDDGSAPTILGFAPLDGEGRAFAVWMSQEDQAGRRTDDVGVYGLLERGAEGDYLLFMPGCEEYRAIAVASGAIVENRNGALVCRFPNRASLEAALRRLRPAPERAISQFVRVADGRE